ncbi:hypothetical protein M9H77_03733 [Catharanthus roseus]|uniref:Uncharacterized protein n=1 Tax=Catharanthus roseus TaxID=4058 RepID=A0ACC0CC48_CATRO|nr:hypothetical protein M9H77_03733 [Catharanthus roseus]
MLGSVTLDLDPVDRGRSTVGGLGPNGWFKKGLPARIAQGGLVEEAKGSSLEESDASKSKKKLGLDLTVGLIEFNSIVLVLFPNPPHPRGASFCIASVARSLGLPCALFSSILKISHEEEQNRNNNEGPSDRLMQEVISTLRSLHQQMGNSERNVRALSAQMDRKESTLGQRKGFHNLDNLTPR